MQIIPNESATELITTFAINSILCVTSPHPPLLNILVVVAVRAPGDTWSNHREWDADRALNAG